MGRSREQGRSVEPFMVSLSNHLNSSFLLLNSQFRRPSLFFTSLFEIRHSIFDIKFSYNERFILRSCSAAKNGQATINYFRPAANLFAGRQGRRWTRHRPIAQTVFGELAESSTPHWPKKSCLPQKVVIWGYLV